MASSVQNKKDREKLLDMLAAEIRKNRRFGMSKEKAAQSAEDKFLKMYSKSEMKAARTEGRFKMKKKGKKKGYGK